MSTGRDVGSEHAADLTSLLARLHSPPVLAAVADADGLLRGVCGNWTELLGWSEGELEGREFLSLVHLQDAEVARNLLDAVREAPDPHRVELRCRRRNGGYQPLSWLGVGDPGRARGVLLGRPLHLDEHRFEQLVAQSQEGVATIGVDGIIRSANARLGELLGVPAETLTGMRAISLIDATPEIARERWLEPLLRGEMAVVRGTVRLLCPVGDPLWAHASARAVRDAQGRVEAVEVLLVDVDWLAGRRQQLELGRAQLDKAQRLARIGHWFADLTTGELVWSAMVYEILGLDPQDMTPSTDGFYAVVHPEDRARVVATDTRTDLPREHRMRFRVVWPDGSVRMVQEIAALSVDERGHRVSHGAIQDITEQHAAEQALRDSEARLQQVIAATQEGWWDIDLRSGETFQSARWYQIHGYRPDELHPTYDVWRALIPDDDLAVADACFAEAVAARAPNFSLETRARHRDGQLLPVRVRGHIEYDEQGAAVRVSGMTSDLTELRRAEAAKEQFVSSVSHELRTPLTAIAGTLETIMAGVSGPVAPATEPLLEVAVRNTTRLRALIDDLLDIEQLHEGTLPLRRERHDLIAVVAEILDDHRALGAPRGVTLHLEVTGPGPVTVVGDRRRLGQVVANLLSNAVKHSPHGGVVQTRVLPDPTQVRVEVIDTGAGVPDSFAGRIFERFARADPSDAPGRGGTGLGLAISRELVRQHDGEIGYESLPGSTVFWFVLPRV